MKHVLVTLFGLLISATAFWIAWRAVDFQRLLDVLEYTNYWMLIFAVFTVVLHLLMKAWRWRQMFGKVVEVRWTELVPAVFAGSMSNMLIPHSGELLRTYIIRRDHKCSAAFLLSTIAVERLFDFIAVLVIVSSVTLFDTQLPELVKQASIVVLIGCACAIAVMVLLAANPIGATRWLGSLTSVLPEHLRARALSVLNRIVSGFGVFRHGRTFLLVFAASIVQWATMAVCIYACILAVSIPVTFAAAIIVMFLTVAGLTLPTAPGYVGTLQLCFIVGLASFGVPDTRAFAAAVLYNGVLVLPLVVLGIAGLAKSGIGIRTIREVRATN